jgi:ankyrin repeat protein
MTITEEQERLAAELFLAVRENDVEQTKMLLALGANPNVTNERGETPLHWSANRGRVEMIELLLSSGADVNAVSSGRTPLDVAAVEGDIRIAEILAEAGAELNAKDEFGMTPLHWAAQGGHDEVAAFLVSKGADMDAKNREGWTPLYQAILAENTDLALWLVEQGADVNAASQNGMTPLHVAAMDGDSRIAMALFVAGADTGARDLKGRTPLDVANPATFDAFLTGMEELRTDEAYAGEGMSQAQRLTQERTEAGAREFALVSLDGGGRAAIFTTDPTEALLWKCVRHDPSGIVFEVEDIHGAAVPVEDLIDAGADVNACDDEAITPLHRAAERGEAETAAVLLACGAKAGAETADGMTPADCAAEKGFWELAHLLKTVDEAQKEREAAHADQALSSKPKKALAEETEAAL